MSANAVAERREEAHGVLISEAEHLWMRELVGWLARGGIDRDLGRRAFLRDALHEILRRFERELRSDDARYVTGLELLENQLRSSLEIAKEAAE